MVEEALEFVTAQFAGYVIEMNLKHRIWVVVLWVSIVIALIGGVGQFH